MFCGRLHFVHCMLWLHVPLDNSIVFHVISLLLLFNETSLIFIIIKHVHFIPSIRSNCGKHRQFFPHLNSYDIVYHIHTVSSEMLCLRLLLVYTSSTFHCRHAAGVLYFVLSSPGFICSESGIRTA
jgi:hypothetical protein